MRPSFDVSWHDALQAWHSADGTARLWERDPQLWTDRDEDRWLGWLALPELEPVALAALRATLERVRSSDPRHVLLLGMGGSSLGAEVLTRVLPRGPQGLPLTIVDSLVPAAVEAAFAAVDWAQVLVVVASKSGSTLEPAVLLDLALQRLQAVHGAAGAQRVLAITDPGSALERLAHERGFAAIVHGRADVGGRFSALSPFGVVPALLIDAPIGELSTHLRRMVDACHAPMATNPGVELGAALAVAARMGRDKCTILLPPSLASLGVWVEQLVAESTGKGGTMILPVVDEARGAASAYADDRCFVHVTVAGDADPDAALVEALRALGHPVVTIETNGPDGLWAEFFRWEFATAVAGSFLGVHPFDQPDVEASKIETRALSDAWASGGVPASDPVLDVAADPAATRAALRDWLHSTRDGDYIGLLAWTPMTPVLRASLSALRTVLRDATRCATTLGFGPRYLHSTGQAFKGGPNTGVFLSLTAAPTDDVSVPGRALSLGTIARAQRDGELRVLRARGRRVLSLHLGEDAASALRVLTQIVTEIT